MVSILPVMDGNVPQIFDRVRLRRNRVRAVARLARHDVLLRHIAAELIERLSLMTQDFESALIIGDYGGFLSPVLLENKVRAMIYADSAASMLSAMGGARRIIFDDECFPFASARFDLIISFWGLHHINDVPGVLRHYVRALKSDGLFMGVLAGGETLRELRSSLQQAENEVLGGISPHVHPFSDLRDMGDLLGRAGFALPVADALPLTINYTHPLALMADLRGMGESNILRARSHRSLRRDVLARMCEIYLARFGDKEGRFPAFFDIHYLTAWAPHPRQQQPLKRGSGQVSLTDIFKG